MKLSFSTRGWGECGWEDFLAAAKATGYSGVELHGVAHSAWSEDGAPFSRANASRTVRRLFDEGLCISCVDSVCDISSADATEDAELTATIQLAQDVSSP